MMNNQPAHTPEPKDVKEAGKHFFRHLWNIIRHQWGWKLTCVLLAAFLWGGLISQNPSLTREKVFNDVTVNITNASALQRNGFIVVSGLEELDSIRFKAQVPQKYYSAASASHYNARVDLSTIRSAGEQKLKIITTNTSAYGTVTDLSVDEITVIVDEYITRSRIPVRVEAKGSAPENVYASANLVADPDFVSISGPRSVVSGVVRCIAQYDMGVLPGGIGTERTAAPFILEDASGNPVDMKNISVMNNGIALDSIIVEQNLYALVKQDLSQVGLITGEAAEGYRVKNVSIMPQNIEVAVRDQTSFVSDLAYLEGSVDVSGMTQSTTVVLPISRPSNVIYVNTDVAYVTVEIEKIEEADDPA